VEKAAYAKRRIYAQGDLDGACFLYSIVNAFVALARREPDFGAVCRALGQVDFPADFLNGEVGTTGRYDGEYARLADNMRRILAALGAEPFVVQRLEGPLSLPMLAAKIAAQSVVVVRYTGDSQHAQGVDHWVCAVGADCPAANAADSPADSSADSSADSAAVILHVACSIRLHKACGGGAAYAERHDSVFDRWSNDVLSQQYPHTLVPGEAFQIALPG